MKTSSPSWPCAALPRASLSPRTTLRVGGEAEWLLEPAHPEELVRAWHAARERGYVPRLLGGGANLVVDDGLLPGVVITTERMARTFRPRPDVTGAEALASAGDPRELFERELPPDAVAPAGAGEAEPCLVAWAGAPLPGLVRIARDLGWAGLEGLVGVPGHLGGGVAMNAGGRWGELWDVVERVRLLLPDGAVVERPRAACAPRYRDGNLGGAVVLGAVLHLAPSSTAVLRAAMRDYLAQKSAAQPVTERSSGCVFQNPDPELSDGRTAGQLVDQAGAKGLARGDAVVSEKHGNFIVNRGGARARDVFELIEVVRERVAERTGVRLALEVQTWRAGERARDAGASARPSPRAERT